MAKKEVKEKLKPTIIVYGTGNGWLAHGKKYHTVASIAQKMLDQEICTLEMPAKKETINEP
jgi:hypothetical protein